MKNASPPLFLLCLYLSVMSALGIYIILKDEQKVKTPIELRQEMNREWVLQWFR